jgi:hypothetical protein
MTIRLTPTSYVVVKSLNSERGDEVLPVPRVIF